jgi:RNA polymerase sigma-70 factor (ECF subfamily)
MSPFIDSEEFRNLLYSWPEKAMRSIYDHVYDDLVRIADMHTHSRALSEDAMQDVFSDIFLRHREIGRARGESILGFLIRAVTNHSITLYRKSSRALQGETEYYYACVDGVHENSAELAIIEQDRQSFLRVILGTLPPREKECMLLRVDHGMSVKEIARRLGITMKAVEWNLRSARNRLKRFRTRVP